MKLTKDLYEFYIADCIKKSVKTIENQTEISIKEILQFPKAIVLKVLGQVIKEKSKTTYPPRLKNIALLYDKIKTETDFKATLSHLTIKCKNGIIYLKPENRN